MRTLYTLIRRDAADTVARQAILDALHAHGNVTRAARALGLDRRYLRRELVRLGLRAPGVQR